MAPAPQTSLTTVYPSGGYCYPPPESSPRDWTSEYYQSAHFEERMRRQQEVFNLNSAKNQRLLHDCVADLKLGLVLSHGELSGKVDGLTVTTSRVESKLAEHSEILSSLQDTVVNLRMDLLHRPSEESRSVEREAQSSQPSTSSAPPSAPAAAVAVALPPPPVSVASSSTSQPLTNSSVPVNNGESSAASNSNADNIPANPLPISNTSQPSGASSTSTVASNGRESDSSIEVIVDCSVRMIGCCGGTVQVPIIFEKGSTRSLDVYICSFCNRPYKKSYYLNHVQSVCLPKLPCSLCGAAPSKTSKRLRRF